MSRLEIGQMAPDFSLPLADGTEFQLSKALAASERGVILYFYPRANTPGCTTEACDFNDSLERLVAAGYTVVGISPDKLAALEKFRNRYDLGFSLASDPEHAVMANYGAWGEKKNYGRLVTGTIRSTLVIDKLGQVVWAGYNVRAKGHVSRVLKELGLQTD